MSRLPLLVLSLTLVAAAVGAATFTVNRTTDAGDTNPGDGFCGGPLGPCSLRQAIQEANALPGADAIILPAGTFLLTSVGQDEDAAATGDLDVLEDLEIVGAGSSVTVISGGDADRVLDLHAAGARPTELRLRHVTVTRGAALTSSTKVGGGIRVRSSTTLRASHCRIAGNAANAGGGIYLDGEDAEADIRYSTLDSNSSIDAGHTACFGPAIADRPIEGERLSLLYSTVSGNVTEGVTPGAITLDFAEPVSVIGSTITSNPAGGLSIYTADVTIVHSTFADNADVGVNFRSSDGAVHSLTMVNSITDGCYIYNASTYTHAGNIDTVDSCELDTSAGEMVWTDPELGPLADNGGPTMTRLPNPGSPAIDAAAGAPHCTSPDQRGVSRPEDGDGDGVASCDIGAVEVADLVFVDTFESGNTSAWPAVAP